MKKFIITLASSFMLLSAPATAIDRANDYKWDSVVRGAASTPGAHTRDGQLDLRRACYAETDSCSTTLMITAPNGVQMWKYVEYRDFNDIITSRWVCKFNSYGDMVKCVDFDTTEVKKAIKVQGEWKETSSWNDQSRQRFYSFRKD